MKRGKLTAAAELDARCGVYGVRRRRAARCATAVCRWRSATTAAAACAEQGGGDGLYALEMERQGRREVNAREGKNLPLPPI